MSEIPKTPETVSPEPGRSGEKHEGFFRRTGRRFDDFCSRHAFRPGKIRLFLILAVVVVLGLGFLAAARSNVSAKVTALGLRNIGELATQAGYFTSVQTIRKSRQVLGIEVPGTQSNYVYSYDGVIKAGLDFEDVDVQVDDLNHVIRVTLPEISVLSTEIDENSFVLYNDGSNLFTSLKLSEVNQSLGELKKKARESAIGNGLLENAKSNAQLLIRGFLAGLYDLSIYTIEFE